MRIVIAGGGTGGHLFPGVAVAEELRTRDPDAKILFVGTGRGIEARVLKPAGWDLELIEVSGIKTVGLLGAIKGIFRIPRALWQSRRILKRFRPQVVLGVGGYASGPLLLVAWLSRIPTAVLEQNSVPGLTNKILGKIVRAVFIAFDETRRFFHKKRIVMTGTPIRQQMRNKLAAVGSPRVHARTRDTPFRLFCFGGSQGAQAINVPLVEAARLLGNRGVDVHVVHQTGAAHEQDIAARYRDAHIDADVSAFIDDMAEQYAAADLVIARAGAATVAELSAVGCPAILVPYPHAAYDHQTLNARELVEKKAAILLPQRELSAEKLAEAISSLARDRAALASMRANMLAIGRPDAAAAVADWLIQNARQDGSVGRTGRAPVV